MSSIEIRRVSSKRDLRTFIDFHYDLYAGNAYDVPNLFSDELNTLDQTKNAAFEFCEADYFIACKDGKPAGRVAAIINHKANEKFGEKSVRFGWIDFVDDEAVSAALMQAVEDYGRSKGMNSVVGPLGFTDMDPEGMLVEGFDQLGTMPTIYNYDYYPRHIERMGGFEVDNRYVEFKVIVPEKMPEKHLKVAEMVRRRYGLQTKKLTRKDVFEGGYGRKVFELVNDTYKNLYGFVEISNRQIDQYVDMYLKMIDLNLVVVVEDSTADNKLCGFGISIPSLSKALQKCRRGRLWPLGWWHVWRAIKYHKTEGVDLLLVGVLPEYRMKGVVALIFADLLPRFQAYGFKWGETQVEIDSNEAVQSQWDYFETHLHKRRICYRKSIAPVERPANS